MIFINISLRTNLSIYINYFSIYTYICNFNYLRFHFKIFSISFFINIAYIRKFFYKINYIMDNLNATFLEKLLANHSYFL